MIGKKPLLTSLTPKTVLKRAQWLHPPTLKDPKVSRTRMDTQKMGLHRMTRRGSFQLTNLTPKSRNQPLSSHHRNVNGKRRDYKRIGTVETLGRPFILVETDPAPRLERQIRRNLWLKLEDLALPDAVAPITAIETFQEGPHPHSGVLPPPKTLHLCDKGSVRAVELVLGRRRGKL